MPIYDKARVRKILWVLFIALLLFILSGIDAIRYKYIHMQGGVVYKIDRIYGDTYLITPSGIKKLEGAPKLL